MDETKRKKPGFVQVPNTFCRASNVSAPACKIFLIIKSDKPPSFRSISNLCQTARFGRTKVQAAIKELESLKIIGVKRRRCVSNRYWVLPEAGWILTSYQKADPDSDWSSPETSQDLAPKPATKNTKEERLTEEPISAPIQHPAFSVEIEKDATGEDDLSSNLLFVDAYGSEEEARLVIERNKTVPKTMK